VGDATEQLDTRAQEIVARGDPADWNAAARSALLFWALVCPAWDRPHAFPGTGTAVIAAHVGTLDAPSSRDAGRDLVRDPEAGKTGDPEAVAGSYPMTVSIRQIHPVFVGEVSGINCADPLSEGEVVAITAGMDEYGVLVFPDQPLTDGQQLRFTLQFGAMEPGFGNIRAHFRAEQEVRTLGTGIADFSNLDGAGKPLPPDSRAYMFKLADRLWHSDSSFKAIPAKWSILSGHAIPSWGGNTEFADMRAAYDAMDERMKHSVEGLVCHHSQIYSREKSGYTELSDAEREAFKPVRQRLVRCHPVTGRKSLFLSSHAGTVEGMSLPEGRMLMMDLAEFATRERFVYSHVWHANDLVIWDNRVTMHRGRPFDASERRDIRQTRLGGDSVTIEQAG
jgi:alpha-ketoglutarate-dependent 2,4-dichlorophenoxyacetate dioxygenase